MSNSKRRRNIQDNDEQEQAERKAGRRNRRQDDADAKASDYRIPEQRLRSRSIRIVRKGHPDEPDGRGRRAEPTRYDAMQIAGHKRLPGYETPPPSREASARDYESRSPEQTEESEAAKRRRSERDAET